MASPIKSVQLSGFSAKSFLLTMVVIAMVIALFFIPELIDFQKSLFGGGSKSAPRVKVTSENVPANQLGSQSESALDKVTDMLNAGYVDQLKAKKVATDSQASDTNAFPQREFSWAIIKSKPSIQALRSAINECRLQLKSMGSDKPATRFAMLNFINAIELVLRDGDKNMTAGEAVNYIQFLQEAVSRNMIKENVDISTYNNFIALPLGPAIDSDRVARLAEQLRPFNPGLVLNGIYIKKPAGYRGRWDEAGPVYVVMHGYVMGQDTKSMELYYNGNFLKSVRVNKSDDYGIRRFNTRRYNGKGIYTFRVFDKAGQIWEKSYSFYPRVKRFKWLGGRFDLPYPNGANDTRLDEFFTFRAGRLVAPASAWDSGEGYSRF